MIKISSKLDTKTTHDAGRMLEDVPPMHKRDILLGPARS